jgi:hypothetical protein
MLKVAKFLFSKYQTFGSTEFTQRKTIETKKKKIEEEEEKATCS